MRKRFGELYYIDRIKAPTKKGNRLIYSRRHADKEKAVYYWREGDDGEEKILLDPNTMSEDGAIAIGRTSVSPDGKYFSYTVRQNAAVEATMYVMNVKTGKISNTDVIPV